MPEGEPLNPFETTPEELRRAGEETLEILTGYWASIPGRRVVPAVTPRQMEQLFEGPVPELGMPLPKGASQAVEAAAKAVAAKHGRDGLAKVAKMHFKTTKAVLGEL